MSKPRIANKSEAMLETIKRIESDEGLTNPPTRVIPISSRADSINWTELRKHYILGKRLQLEDGTWVSEDYTYAQLCEKFSAPGCEIKYNTLKTVARQQGWVKLRKAYLMRVNEVNIGMELGLYTQENFQAEVSAMSACDKLGTVLDKYIEHRFGDILEAAEDVGSTGLETLSEDALAAMSKVNQNTGIPIFLNEVKEAVRVASDIYTLQRKIHDNRPQTESEILEELQSKPKFRDENERQAKIAQLEARLGKSLSQVKVEQAEAVELEKTKEDNKLQSRIRYREQRGLPLDDLNLDGTASPYTINLSADEVLDMTYDTNPR
jgi:hypothetical protein